MAKPSIFQLNGIKKDQKFIMKYRVNVRLKKADRVRCAKFLKYGHLLKEVTAICTNSNYSETIDNTKKELGLSTKRPFYPSPKPWGRHVSPNLIRHNTNGKIFFNFIFKENQSVRYILEPGKRRKYTSLPNELQLAIIKVTGYPYSDKQARYGLRDYKNQVKYKNILVSNIISIEMLD